MYLIRVHKTVEHSNLDAFLLDLRNKATTCEIGSLQDSLIKDRIVCGIDDKSVRERLLRDNDLTLDKAINIVRAAETSKTQVEKLSNPPIEVESLNQNSDRKSRRKHQEEMQPSRRASKTNRCSRCGSSHGPKQCPALGQTCHKCHGNNHFAKMCRSKALHRPYTKSRVYEVRKEESTDKSSAEENELFIGELMKTTTTGNVLVTNLKVNNKSVKFKIDTGAQCNVLPEEIFDKIKKKPKLVATRTKLTAYGGTPVPVIGKCSLEIEQTANRKLDAEFFVVKAPNAKPLIGLQTCQNFELININQVNDVQEKKNDLLEEYEDVFMGLGLVEGEYHIDSEENAKPTIQPPRKVPLSLLPKLKETLDNLTKSGVVSKLDRPTDWVNSLVIVEKKDGSLRLCLDPKDLNNAIKRGHYKAPSAETISNHLSGKKIFTVIDMSHCYWHKKLDEESSYLCAFNTPFGRYKFNRMPFGICSVADVAQQMVDDEFSDIPGALAVHDDIIVSGATTEEHDTALEEVLKRARERNIKFNKKKVQLRVTEVKYLGNIVSAKGFTPDPEKIRAIIEMPPPESKQDLRRLLGMVNYLSQYIPNMSEITAPLRSLLKKDVQWSWHDEHRKSLERIQQVLTSNPVLQFYDINKPAILQVDASQGGLGACLIQEGHPVVYASRSLTVAEQHYAQIEKELLAIVFACERFNQFIYGKQVTVESDHKPLEAIITKPLSQAPPRIQRLLIRLQKYQPMVKYVPGKFLFIADTLSRAYLPAKGEQQELNEDIEVMVHSMVTEIPASPEKIEELKKETAKDETLSQLKKQMIEGWPNHKHEVPQSIAIYWNIRHDLRRSNLQRSPVSHTYSNETRYAQPNPRKSSWDREMQITSEGNSLLAWNVKRHPRKSVEVCHLRDIQNEKPERTNDSTPHT